MKTIRPLLFIFFLTVILAGCKDKAETPLENDDVTVSTFYFIRHAEKDRSNPEEIDPELTQRGLGRAMHWAEILNGVDLNAIYTTDFQRTTMTAAPTAVKQDLTVTYYDPDEIDLELFKSNNLGGNVLVVGHSNSTPAMVNKLLGAEKYEPMDDYDNGSLFIVQMVGDEITDLRLRFDCNCPQ